MLLTVVLPGIPVTSLTACYLLEWVVLEVSFMPYNQVVNQFSRIRELLVAQAAENRHRINCFAKEVGVLGSKIFAIGMCMESVLNLENSLIMVVLCYKLLTQSSKLKTHNFA